MASRVDTAGEQVGEPGGGQATFSIWRRSVVSWALYDFANTIFSFAVITQYFNKWVIEDQGAPDWYVGAMGFVVGLVLLITMVPLGAIADRYQRRMPFLIGFTVLSAGATAALVAADTVMTALFIGGLAIFAFQSALAHYDPLLASVAPEGERGRVSGFGVGMGYLGALLGAGALLVIVGDGSRQDAFLPTAALYLLFALPCFLFVREQRATTAVQHPPAREVSSAAFRQLAITARNMSQYRDVGRFLIGRFLYADALTTTLAFMTIYMGRVGDFSKTTEFTVLGTAMLFAALSGFVCGRFVDRLGPRWVLNRILLVFTGTLIAAAVFAVPLSVWILGPLVGICLGGTWTSDRVFMMRLSPPQYRGEFFGFYNLIGKLSSGVGPLVFWGGTTWLLHEKAGWTDLNASRVALVVLACAAFAGLMIIRGIDDSERTWSGDEGAVVEPDPEPVPA